MVEEPNLRWNEEDLGNIFLGDIVSKIEEGRRNMLSNSVNWGSKAKVGKE